jgi:pilus assembly protein CpaC
MQRTRTVSGPIRALAAGTPILIIAVFGGLVHAQVPAAGAPPVVAAQAAQSAAASTSPAVEAPADDVRLLVGRSALLDVGTPIARVSLTSAEIADALVTSPSQVLVHGKGPGAISMFVWSRGGAVRRYEVSVQRDLVRLTEQVKTLFPTERIEVRGNGKSIVLSGTVSTKDVIDRAVNVAVGHVEKKEEVVSLLQVRAAAASNQVLLRVRFAEVSRTALTEFGMNFFTSPTGIKNTVGRVTTQQYPAPNFSDMAWTKANGDFGSPVTSAEGKFNFSDFLNLFLLSERYDLGTVIRAMQARGLFQSLAEPNLVAESGKEASFLAGGEFPIPVVQGSQSGSAVSIQFKEFGVRLNFTPTVNGDRVHLKVRPEVSTLDYANGVSLQGFRVPALSTRRTETELELRNGQTFAIAGLMNNTLTSSLQKVPGIGDIPILGHLFRSRAANKAQTELVVMITPEILAADSPGLTTDLPRLPEPYLPPLPENRTRPEPPAAFTPERRSSVSAPVPGAAAEAERKALESAREQAAWEARQQAEAEKLRAAQQKREQAEAAKAAAKLAEEQAKEQKAAQRTEAKRAAETAKQQEADRKRQEKEAREQQKREQEAAERATKVAKAAAADGGENPPPRVAVP